jgi:hypothetical protein
MRNNQFVDLTAPGRAVQEAVNCCVAAPDEFEPVLAKLRQATDLIMRMRPRARREYVIRRDVERATVEEFITRLELRGADDTLVRRAYVELSERFPAIH